MARTSVIVIGIIVTQIAVTALSYRAFNADRATPPDKVLGEIVFSFFFWWLILPVASAWALNDWVTEYVKRRRANAGLPSQKLKSGQDNGLYQ